MSDESAVGPGIGGFRWRVSRCYPPDTRERCVALHFHSLVGEEPGFALSFVFAAEVARRLVKQIELMASDMPDEELGA